MRKEKITESKKAEMAAIQKDIEQAINVTLELFRGFGEGEATQVPEKLQQMGVFQDQAFLNFLAAFHQAVALTGPETVEKFRQGKDVSPQDRYLDKESFNFLLCSGMIAMTFFTPTKGEEMERVKTYVYDRYVGSFLIEFAENIIARELAGLSSRQQLLDSYLGKE